MGRSLCFLILLVASICVGNGYSANANAFSLPSYCSANRNPCMNGGLCLNYASSYKCLCSGNCRGEHCEKCGAVLPERIFGVCSPNPCQRDCQCRESCQHAGGYYCRSSSGYLGKNCTIPMPSLRCESDRIVFSVSESFVREYDLGLRNSFINIVRNLGGTQGCEVSTAVNEFYEIQIPMPFTACGTEVTSVGGNVVVTNQMWFNRRLSNSMFDMPIPVAEFQCSYERQYTVVTSLRPVVSTPTVVTGRQIITPSISLCKVPACPGVCPLNFAVNGGAIYTVGEMIHVTMSIDSGNQVTGIDEMYLSCSPVPSTNNIVGIVQAGCGTTNGLPCEITTSAVGHTVCVSFQTPRSMSCQEFYIHAKLVSCDRGSVGACSDNFRVNRCLVSRKRRSLGSAPIALGPIVVINGSVGIPEVRLNGMEADEVRVERVLESDPKKETAFVLEDSPVVDVTAPEPASAGMNYQTMVIVISSGIVLLILVALLFVVIRNRSVTFATMTSKS
uniref:uncharacterized protein LOC120334241 isoform X1 n=1 Tax=Styela clava TaxID=7725 RepID=UPI00193933D0|nr:uncharacterized protein LOC120334241 isoform X1 [Styela clava]